MPARCRIPSPRLAALLVAVALAGCGMRSPIPMYGGYPAVALTVGAPVAVSGADTLWALEVGRVTVLSPRRGALAGPFPELTSASRAWERVFGTPASPVNLRFVGNGRRGRRAAAASLAPLPLPDSLAGRPTVGQPMPLVAAERGDGTMRSDGDGLTREDIDSAAREDQTWAGRGMGRRVAQRWLDTEVMRVRGATVADTAEGGASAALPAWLHAGLVGVIGGGRRSREVGRTYRRVVEADVPALDSLLVLGCAPRRSNGACGPAFHDLSASFLAFLLEREGDTFGATLVQAAVTGRSFASLLPGRRLPATTAAVDLAWRAWRTEGR